MMGLGGGAAALAMRTASDAQPKIDHTIMGQIEGSTGADALVSRRIDDFGFDRLSQGEKTYASGAGRSCIGEKVFIEFGSEAGCDSLVGLRPGGHDCLRSDEGDSPSEPVASQYANICSTGHWGLFCS